MKRLGKRARYAVALVGITLAARFGLAYVVPVDPSRLLRPDESRGIVDRHGTPLRYVRARTGDHAWVPLAEVAPGFLDAIVAAEDARFFEHDGLDDRALLRAVLSWVLPIGRRSGGSTISMQVVKLAYGRPRGLPAKLVEIARALALERVLAKDAILEQYVNRLPFGHGIVGVERASQIYFGKPARELTLAEAALLAGIPQGPSITEPRRHLRRALARRAYVLDRLQALGLVDADAIALARSTPPAIVPETPHPYRAPRFVDAVLEELRRAPPLGPDRTVRTSLDLPLQRVAETILERAAERTSPHSNAAALVVSLASGEALAYVGAARQDGPGGALDLLRTRRHPGSTLKPFAYALFFANGGSPATPLGDATQRMTLEDGRLYEARNFDAIPRGRVSARRALAASLNLAALDVARRLGTTRLVDGFVALGLEAVRAPETHGAGLVLGGASVSPRELALAYLALARNGTRIPLSLVPTERQEGTRVLDEGAAALASDVLFDANARREGFGDDLRTLAPTSPFALKTGTSPGPRDVWAAVYDHELLALVWIGDPSGRPIAGATGFANAAPAAVALLAEARTRIAARTFGPRSPIEQVTLARFGVCAFSGTAPGPTCPTHLERFVPGRVPTTVCDGRHDAPLPTGVERPRAFRVLHPEDGQTIYVDVSRPAPEIVLRAGPSDGPTSFELDGAPVRAGRAVVPPGRHVVRARDARGHAATARFEVVAVGR